MPVYLAEVFLMIPMAYILVLGEIDISVGATVCLSATLSCIMSVSYTHLDVYKRQIHIQVLLLIWQSHRMQTDTSGLLSLKDVYKRQSGIREVWMAFWIA